MDNLIHYTSNFGAIGIIESGCLFATSYKFLNDSKEMHLIKDILNPIFARDFEDRATELIETGRINTDFIKEYGRSIYAKEAGNLVDTLLYATDKLSPVFITSFCSHEEGGQSWRDGLLSQWRAYGSSGGCALEFDHKGIDERIDLEKKTYDYVHISQKPVIYKNYEDSYEFEKISGFAKSVLDNVLLSEDDQTTFEPLYEAVAVVNPQLKSASFAEENETRIIAAPASYRKEGTGSEKIYRKMFFRDKSGIPVPSIRLFEKSGSLPIKRIIVGPQRERDLVAYSLQKCLEQCEIDCDVITSSISYIP